MKRLFKKVRDIYISTLTFLANIPGYIQVISKHYKRKAKQKKAYYDMMDMIQKFQVKVS